MAPHYAHEISGWDVPEGKSVPNIDRPPKMLQCQMYFSNDPHHDPTYVKHNNAHLLSELHKQRADFKIPPLEGVTYLSDGGPGHYKQKENFSTTVIQVNFI